MAAHGRNIGVSHVCIGTDTKLTPPSPRRNAAPPGGQPFGQSPGAPGPGGAKAGGSARARSGERTNQAWEGEPAGFYFVVADAMLRSGFTPDEIGKIGGGNFLRVFGEATKN